MIELGKFWTVAGGLAAVSTCVKSLGLTGQAAEGKALRNRIITFLGRHDRKGLRILITDTEDRDAVAVKRRLLRDLRGDLHVFHIRRGMESDIVAGLLSRFAGETGVIVNILQRTGDGILTEDYTGLKIAGMFAEQILRAGIGFNGQL